MINNAGVMLLGPILDAPTEEWDRMVALNVNGLLYVAHAALPHLLRAAEDGPRQVADLVNVSSVAGRRATLGSGVYNATKFGVNAFSEALRQEVTERHVRVSVIEPGAVATELSSHNRPRLEDPRERARRRSRLRRRIERADGGADIADAIAYVVTRAAARSRSTSSLVRPHRAGRAAPPTGRRARLLRRRALLQHVEQRRVGLAGRLGDGLVGDLAGDDVDAARPGPGSRAPRARRPRRPGAARTAAWRWSARR